MTDNEIELVETLAAEKRQAGAKEERKAVVRWLRDMGRVTEHEDLLDSLAADIEAGEHRK